MVLFSDLVGSTELSLSLDPEDYAAVVLTYQETGGRLVASHGGSVANYVGDGLVAQFRYPVAHQDDADRALRAAMAIRQAVEQLSRSFRPHAAGLRVRVAIHAGVSVVGHMGSDERGDLALFGDTANIAARVQSTGEPNQVLITEDVAARLRDEFLLDDFGAPALKGVKRPVRVYGVIGDACARPRRGSAPMVGRENELRLLQQRLEASRNGAGGGLGICGPAGVGKSRLVAALAEDVVSRQWLEVRGSELASDSAFSTMTQLLARALGLPASADEPVRAEHLEQFLDAHPLPDVSSTPLVAVVTGDPLVTAQSSESAFRSVIELALHVVLAAVEDLRHAVVVVEDLHWVDPSSRAFVTRLVDAARTRPLLVLLTERPDPASGHSTVAEVVDVLPVEPLPDDQMRHLVGGLTTVSVDDRVMETIVHRAEGIPLFAEELARVARRSSVSELPYTLQASFLARLDPLAAWQRVRASLRNPEGRETRHLSFWGKRGPVGSSGAGVQAGDSFPWRRAVIE